MATVKIMFNEMYTNKKPWLDDTGICILNKITLKSLARSQTGVSWSASSILPRRHAFGSPAVKDKSL